MYVAYDHNHRQRVSRRKRNYWARQVWLSVIFLLMFWVFQFFIPFFRLSCTQGEANAKLFRTMHRRRKTLKWEVSSPKNDFPHQVEKPTSFHVMVISSQCSFRITSIKLIWWPTPTAHPPSFPLSFFPFLLPLFIPSSSSFLLVLLLF